MGFLGQFSVLRMSQSKRCIIWLLQLPLFALISSLIWSERCWVKSISLSGVLVMFTQYSLEMLKGGGTLRSNASGEFNAILPKRDQVAVFYRKTCYKSISTLFQRKSVTSINNLKWCWSGRPFLIDMFLMWRYCFRSAGIARPKLF